MAESKQQKPPEDIQLIGRELAVKWPDGTEHYFDPEFLREKSPSAENVGEVDILGQRHGGEPGRRFPGVEVTGWAYVGAYGLRLLFSDGHNTGIYTWPFLYELGEAGTAPEG